LDDTLHPGQLALFLQLFPVPGEGDPILSLDLFQDGRLLRRINAPPPAPAEDGSIPFLTRISTEGLPPGPYELRAALVQGQRAAASSLPFTLE